MPTQAQVEKAITYLAPNALVSEIAALVVSSGAGWRNQLTTYLMAPTITRRQRIAVLAAVSAIAE